MINVVSKEIILWDAIHNALEQIRNCLGTESTSVLEWLLVSVLSAVLIAVIGRLVPPLSTKISYIGDKVLGGNLVPPGVKATHINSVKQQATIVRLHRRPFCIGMPG